MFPTRALLGRSVWKGKLTIFLPGLLDLQLGNEPPLTCHLQARISSRM